MRGPDLVGALVREAESRAARGPRVLPSASSTVPGIKPASELRVRVAVLDGFGSEVEALRLERRVSDPTVDGDVR